MLSLPNPPKIVKKEGNKAVFELEALYPGYGITVGNSLRRVLLSSLEGAAVTQMKIKGISHEFSTIPGVLEDVITIMLNLKQLRFKLLVSEPQKVTLKVKGAKEIKGSDFSLPSQVELVNKNCHIATLTSKSAELEMEIQIEKGIGYSFRSSRQKEKLEIGAIPVDAIFTPIRRISYKIENMRVGERTDFDRLFLEVETDGTMAPEDAVLQSCETLINHFSLFSETLKLKTVSEAKPAAEKKPAARKKAAQAKKVAPKKKKVSKVKKSKK
jgi:DNA-directed RNA polymerase subunit alpha